MPPEFHAIVNPASGNGRTGRRWPELARRIRGLGLSLHERCTTGPGDATRITRELLAAGAREIVAVGGDGTVNEIANGFFDETNAAAPGAVLSIIPCGTGRDLSRSLGIRTVEDAAVLLANGKACAIDVGRVTFRDGDEMRSRYFVNIADVGLGAETAALINRSSKVLGGMMAYLIGATRTILAFHGHHVTVDIDGIRVHDGRAGMVVLANGRYHAGGMFLAPAASLVDGQFEILVLHDVPKPMLLGSLLPRVYSGKHIGHPAVSCWRGRCVEVRSEATLLFEADGEQLGTTDLSAVIVPAALAIRIPAHTAAALRPS